MYLGDNISKIGSKMLVQNHADAVTKKKALHKKSISTENKTKIN